MNIWLLCLPVAFGLFAAVTYAMHRLSPLKNMTAATPLSKKTKLIIYGTIIISFLVASLPFTDIFNGSSASGFVLIMIVCGLVAAAATECGYFLSKKNEWNKALLYASVMIGTFFTELVLVIGYAASLPPGSVT